MIFATHAGIALAAAEARTEAHRVEHLEQALSSRELIGQAQGILMERERITANQAFDVLRRGSQHLNVKLREVAQRVVDTGERPRHRCRATAACLRAFAVRPASERGGATTERVSGSL